MSEDKLKELLLKIRKGATSSLSWGQLGEVFGAFDPGWKLEKAVSLVSLYGYKGGEDNPATYVGLDDPNAAKKKHDELAKDAVTSLPSNPKHGKLYVMDLGLVDKNRYDQDYFQCKPWMGHDSWKVSTPDGKEFEALPWKYNLGDLQHGFQVSTRGRISPADTLTWLTKETDFLDQINKKLGIGVFEPAAPRTRDKTGSCPVCFQNIKINDGKMVLHGYKRPGTGSTHGSCWGVAFKAFELSDDGCKDYLEKHVRPQLEAQTSFAARLKSGKVHTLTMRDGKSISVGDKNWDHHLTNATQETDRNVIMWTGITKDYSNLISHWKLRDLPKEGDRHIDWYYQGQKD